MTKKTIYTLTGICCAIVLFAGCFPTGWHGDDPGPTYVTFDNIFPFTTSGKVWDYTDEDGNDFVITVRDTISDEGDLYYKVEFREVKLNMVQSDWFISEPSGIKYSERLKGRFQLFLPRRFLSRGGTFESDCQNIRYEIFKSLSLGGKTYRDVLKLSYTTAVLHGFDEVYFADNIGIVQMVDYGGRWPVYYSLN